MLKRIRWNRLVLPVALVVASLEMATHFQEKDNAGPDQALSESSAVPSTTGDWWSSVQRGLAEYEYHPRKNDKGLQAPNRAHNLRTYFDATGIRVQDRTAPGSPHLAGLSLARMGHGEDLEPVPAGTVSHTEARVEIRRPGVTEWYENSALGLEQGFMLPTRIEGEGPLVLELAVDGAEASLHEQTVELATNAGRRLRYGKLIAQDATGRVLPSRLEVPSPHRVRLVVEDIGARYPLVIDPLLTGVPDAFFESNQPDPPGIQPAAFGGSVASAGDVNGDGFADVIVGATGWDGGLIHEGVAFVFLGSAAGIVGSNPATAHAQIDSLQPSAELGTVSGAGDVNGDGFDDIIVGAHFYQSTIENGTLAVKGAAFVFHGSANGITATDVSTADAWIQSDAFDSNLGSSVSGVGDVNGDGFDDILIGALTYGIPFENPNIPINDRQGNAGAALVFLGSAAGIVGTGFSDADSVLTPYPPSQPGTAGLMGASVSGAGDVNNDGFADVIVGAPSLPGSPAGAAVVFLGSGTGIVGTDPSNAHATIRSDALTPLGAAVSGAGDINADGFSDIVLGAPTATAGDPAVVQEGAVLVFLGGPAGITATSPADAQTTFKGNMAAEWLGIRVSGTGDVDGDGFDDIIVGARIYPGSLASEGVCYVFRGSGQGIIGDSLRDFYVRFSSGQTGGVVLGNRFSMDVAGAQDVNGDGWADVIVGHGYYDAGEENEGAAALYFGGPAPINLNVAPVAIPGANQLVVDTDNSFSETVTLDGNQSFDPDGSIVAFRWLEGETLLGTSAILTTDLGVGFHVLVLTVTDDGGKTIGAPVQVKVDIIENQQVAGDDFDTGTLTGGFGTWVDGWTPIGNASLVNSGGQAFSPQHNARIGQSPASLTRSVNVPVGTTGLEFRYWARAGSFAATDEVQVQLRRDGGPFTTVETITSAASDGNYQFHNINFSWYPSTASNVVIRFVSDLSTGELFVDNVLVRAHLAPITGNQVPIANAGLDQTVTDSNGDGVEAVTLDGAASSDPDGSIVSYQWHEGSSLLGEGATLNHSFGTGSHVVTLTVTDNGGALASDPVNVTVEGSAPAGSLASDDFESASFSGGTGSWFGGWATAGDVRIRTNRNSPHAGSSHVRLRNAGASLSRSVDLLGASGMHLTYWGRANRLSGSDQLLVRISVDGGVSFTTVETITAADSNNIYGFHDIDLSALSMTSTVEILFESNWRGGRFFIDDVDIIGGVGPAPNQPPVANAGSNQSASDGDGDDQHTFTLNGSASSDPDGSNLSYAWTEGGAPLGSGAILSVLLNAGAHTITLTVTDGEGATDSATTLVTLTANQTPVVGAGIDQVVNDGDFSGAESVTLSESGSFDPDGNIVSFEWWEGPILLGSGATLTRAFDVGTHTLTLTAMDNGGATASDTTNVTVSANQAPVANAGPDQTIIDVDQNAIELVTFDGTASSDPDGTIVSYFWTKNGNPFNNLATFTLTQPLGVHTVTLTVTDDQGATSTDTVVVEVVATPPPPGNTPPTANAGPDQTVTDTDGDGLASVLLDGTASSDPEGPIADYEWWEGPTLLGTAFVQGVPLSVGVHTITLIVYDNDLATGTDTVIVTVNPGTTNQSPVANAGADQTLTDSDGDGIETATLDGSGSTDSDGTITYRWSEGTSVLGNTVTLVRPFGVGTHTVLLTVTDDAGATSTDSVIVTVNAGGAAPQGVVAITGPSSIDRGDNVSFTVTLTNTGTSTLTAVQLSLSVSPNDRIKDLSPGGQVSVANVPPGGSVSQTWSGRGDREGSTTVTAEAFSGGVSLDTAAQALTVQK